MTKRIVLLCITVLMGVVLVLGGCSAGANEPEPNLIGWIDSVNQPQGGTPGQILVSSPDNNTSDKFMVTVTEKTIIRYQVSRKDEKADFNSFTEGQKVGIWFTGPVMESYPAQVSADKIVIIEESNTTVMPPLDDGVKSVLMEISCEEFLATTHVTREIEITFPGSLVVSLCANPTTGFQWEEVQIGDESVIYQTEHNFVPLKPQE